MKYLVFYEMAAEGLAKAQANVAAHQARLKEFHQRGTLLMVGPYGTPPLWEFSRHAQLLRSLSPAIHS